MVVSAISVVWTTSASIVAVGLGVSSGTTVLVAFGAVGLVDAVGSVALVSHFRHALHHEQYSVTGERLAHRIVLGSLCVVGAGAIVVGVLRATSGTASEVSPLGIGFTLGSLVACAVLAATKTRVAHATGSAALASDAQVSAIGAVQAGVALLGAVATEVAGWARADGVATGIVGAGAVVLAVTTWRTELRGGARPSPSRAQPDVAPDMTRE
jgi:divalent metal cation (Fe/Co/Zn/Cd) transporter